MKRLNNTFSLKVKYLPMTNTKPTRIKITELNTLDSIIINRDYEYQSGSIQVYALLEKVHFIKSFQHVIDNSQNNYDVIVYQSDLEWNSIVSEIKTIVKRGK